jgi:hypothetical protein
MDPYQIVQLIEQYNENPDRYTDEEAEFIAQLAQGMNTRFERESKPIQKGLFDLVDTAAFGLIPDKFRPTTRGETVFGDTGEEELASLLGLVGGGVAGGVGLVKGGRGLINRFKRGKKSSGGNSMTNYGGADVDADRKNSLLQLTSGTKNKSTKRLNPYSSDIDIEINRLEREAAMGDYSSWERLKDLYKYQSGYTGNIDYRRRFGGIDNFGVFEKNLGVLNTDDLPF